MCDTQGVMMVLSRAKRPLLWKYSLVSFPPSTQGGDIEVRIAQNSLFGLTYGSQEVFLSWAKSSYLRAGLQQP